MSFSLCKRQTRGVRCCSDWPGAVSEYGERGAEGEPTLATVTHLAEAREQYGRARIMESFLHKPPMFACLEEKHIYCCRES
jgi:hypothetical protein